MTKGKNQGINNQIDQEWLELILEAKQLGLSYDEIRTFFEKNASLRP